MHTKYSCPFNTQLSIIARERLSFHLLWGLLKEQVYKKKVFNLYITNISVDQNHKLILHIQLRMCKEASFSQWYCIINNKCNSAIPKLGSSTISLIITFLYIKHKFWSVIALLQFPNQSHALQNLNRVVTISVNH